MAGKTAGRAALPNGLLLHVWDVGYGVGLFSRTFLVSPTVLLVVLASW
jgi:hypothetical protein